MPTHNALRTSAPHSSISLHLTCLNARFEHTEASELRYGDNLDVRYIETTLDTLEQEIDINCQ